MRLARTLPIAFAAASIACLPVTSHAQAFAGTTTDLAAPPGDNYAVAEFRFWVPAQPAHLDAMLVLVPGSNGDGRPMAQDSVWQAFAAQHHLAIVACRFTDKPHEQSFIEHYVNVSKGSGQALLDAIATFAGRSGHPELAQAPFLMWGMSAGGQFNYEFVAWRPERVIAFVVNKGGIYYSALLSPEARQVPGILFIGGKDLEFRTNTITGLFAVNRRGGALWALAEEPSAAHIVGRSRDVSLIFFDDVLPMRLTAPANGGGRYTLQPIAEKSGFIGDLKAKTFAPLGDGRAPNYPTAWLPTQRTARAWQAMVTEQPFEP